MGSKSKISIRFLYYLILLVLVFLWFKQSAVAQLIDVGEVKNWKKLPTGVEGSTDKAIFKVSFWNEHTLRVRISQKSEWDDFSFVLSGQPNIAVHDMDVLENDSSIILSSNFLKVFIDKYPSFRVTVKNANDEVVSEDKRGFGFGYHFIGDKATIYKKLQSNERFIGLGEVLGDLDKKGTGHTLNNTDTYKYGDPRLPMYVSIPFFIGIHSNQLYGFFLNNTFKSFFNFGLSTPDFSSVTTEGGDIDYFIIHDTDIAGILKHYTSITGRMSLPPRWALGYHQSKCSYFPQDQVKLLADNFRAKKLPIDCIVLDADYLQDYEPFRINTSRFPDMSGLTHYLKEKNIEVTASVNPGIKRDSTYFAHYDGIKNDVFVKFADGSLYTAEIAPSLNNFVDFTSAKGRQWWSDHMVFLSRSGIHGYWNDMNEPAVGGSYLPDNLVFDFDGRKATALEAKNLYGMLMAQSSHQAALNHSKNLRPFILSRSGFAGIQRYAAIWTGDNTAADSYLLGGALLNTQLGLSGIPFVGDDIGGYIGTTSKNLFIRWMQTGLFAPYARNHKEAFAVANEPWSYGEEAEAISRAYLNFRYRLMPYFYSTFYESTQNGSPIVRSLAFRYPFDKLVYDEIYQYQFTLGDAILVVPVTPSESIKKVYLPEGQWYDIMSDTLFIGNQELMMNPALHEIPLFIKSSSMIPMQKLVQSNAEHPGDTLYLHVYAGVDSSQFLYYDDDGISRKYQSGEYHQRLIHYQPLSKSLLFKKSEGNYQSPFRFIKIIMHGFDLKTEFTINHSNPLLSRIETKQLFDPLEYLKDIYDSSYFNFLTNKHKPRPQITLIVPYDYHSFTINWK